MDFGFGNKFHDADHFTCPGNSDNKCDDNFKGGLDWKDLVPGSFDHYLGFDFKGWTCEDGLDGIGKIIKGTCGKDRDQAPSFGCGSKSDFDKFSVKEFEVDVEFDCRLEFHYDMPDGSTCKHSSDCKKGGKNKIRNTQCGGATDVHIIFPEQPDKPKDTCKIEIPKIDFDCDDNTPPEEPEPTPEPTTETPEEPEPTTETPQQPTSSPVSPPVVPSHSIPAGNSTIPSVPSVPTTTSPPEVTPPPATTGLTTSTIYTTTTKTITDCGPEVPDCPAHSTTVVTETIAISTTVCPITEVPSATSEELPVETTDVPDVDLPCPDVVPKCLNTWIHVVKECKDNLDVSCFCPNKKFVEETYACLYAHGETDDIIAEAVQFFQGICAPYIPENPGIVTGIDTITSCITVTGTPTVTSAHYTTIIVETTITEPCSSDGTPIPSSSTTKTVSTEITVPEVPIPTKPAPSQSQELPGVPATTVPSQSQELPGVPATTAPYPIPTTTFVTTNPPIGTISQPAPTAPQPPPSAGAAHVRAGMGLGLAVMAVAAAL